MISLASPPIVIPAPAAEQERAIAPLILAFANDPAIRWMYPDAHQYRLFFPRFVRAFGGRAFAGGTAQSLDGWLGTALWLPPGIAPAEEELAPLLQESVAADRLGDVMALLERMGQLHPVEEHWYLPLIGVDPRRQRQGLGAALLESRLDELDRQGGAAYLEATNPESVPFYERHGFAVCGEIQAGSSPSLFAMLRKSR